MLTLEQQQALDDLFTRLEGKGEPAVAPSPDFWQTWFGLSHEQLGQKWQEFMNQKNGWENQFIDWLEANPMEGAYRFLGSAAVAFYFAEKDSNPQVNTYIDAFHYIATCASVGYADIFPVTQTGKAIAAMVMVIGPSVADRSLNRSASQIIGAEPES